MCGCWQQNPHDRPKFHEIFDTLTSFLSEENQDYERSETLEIDSDYYLIASTEEDKPIFKPPPPLPQEPPPDYDFPQPVTHAPSPPAIGRDNKAFDGYYTNAEPYTRNSNGNNNIKRHSLERPHAGRIQPMRPSPRMAGGREDTVYLEFS